MKRLLKAVASFSAAFFLRYPAWATMTTMGTGLLVVSALLAPPTVTPQPSAMFSQANAFGSINMALVPPTAATAFPATTTDSWALYHELSLSPGAPSSFLFGSGNSATFGVIVSGTSSPLLLIRRSDGAQWWLPTVAGGSGASLTGSGYNGGAYVWTAADGCQPSNGAGAREPQGIIIQGANTDQNVTVDPGFLCSENSSGLAPQVPFASIPGVGSSQAVTVNSCSSNTPIAGEYQITATVGVAHGLSPGGSFTLTGTANFNNNFAAALGTEGTTLVGVIQASSGTCPATPDSGTLSGGTANTVTLPLPTPASMYITNSGTGIQFKEGQRVCGLIGEFGADSNFPGAQFAKYTDITGADVPGSPAVSPWLNQGATNFTGFTTAGTQSTGNPALTVTAMNSTPITGATFSGGQVSFTTGASNGFIIGSEFVVSGMTPSGYNGAYVAVAGTNETTGQTLVGQPLTAAVGLPKTITNPGSFSNVGTPSLVGVIMPGMAVVGSVGFVLPYGVFASTGTGGVGTYGLVSNPASFTFTGSLPASSSTLTLNSAPNPPIAVGHTITSGSYTGVVTAMLTGAGLANSTYTVSPANGTTALTSATFTDAGTIGSSSSPVNIYAAETQYYTAAPSPTAPGGGTTTVASQGPFVSSIGAAQTIGGALTGGHTFGGWSGGIANIGMFEGAPFPSSGGIPSASAMTNLCTKTTDFQSFAATNGGAWKSLYKLNDPGIWADHSVAEITGSVAAGTATLTVGSTQFGSTSLSTGQVVSGAGLCANSVCPTISTVVTAGSIYTLSQTFSSGIPSEAMSVGNVQPAAPLSTQQVTGFISGGTLTVVGVPSSNTTTTVFTGSIGTGTAGSIGNSTGSISAITSGSLSAPQCIWDGGVNIQPNNPLCVSAGGGVAGGTFTVNQGVGGFNFYPAIATEPMFATGVRVVSGQYLMASGITTPIQIMAPASLTTCTNDFTVAGSTVSSGFPFCGTYTVSNPGNLTVGSSSSPVTLTLSGVTAGGAIAPGAALTVENPGTGNPYPVTNFSTNTGVLTFNGEFNTSLLHGNPKAIQAQLSLTPGGPAVSGCSPCAFTTLSNEVINTGAQTWSGSVVNIPAGGPYFVSFRASNGQAYATLTNPVFVGLTFAGFGEGNAHDQVSSGESFVDNQTYFPSFNTQIGAATGGLPSTDESGSNFIAGPLILNSFVPSFASQSLYDSYGIFAGAGSLNDGVMGEINNANAALGIPVSISDMYKNGSGQTMFGGVAQTQTVGIGTGSQVVFSSGAGFGGTMNTSGGAVASPITASITSAGVMSVTGGFGSAQPWSFLAPGQAVTCASCASGSAPYSGIITGFDSGNGNTGTYFVSPGATVASSTLTVTHNNLAFNGALGFGAQINGTVASNVLTINTILNGVVAPLMTVGDGTNSATIEACLTNCSLLGASQDSPTSSTWQLSSGIPNETANMTAQPPGGALWPSATPVNNAIPVTTVNAGTGYVPLIQVGTLQILVNGTAECADTTTFAYNIKAGTLAGSGCSGWVNYVTGSYAVTFTSAPASGATIVARWTNIMSTDSSGGDEQLDYVGSSSPTSGSLAAVASRSGGVNAYLQGEQAGPTWPDAALNTAHQFDWFYSTHLAQLPNGLVNQPMLNTGAWHGMGSESFFGGFSGANKDTEELDQDFSRVSNFNGTISAPTGSGTAMAVLTLNSASDIWEGEALECNPFSLTCPLPLGTEVVSICTAALCGAASPNAVGTVGSTYAVTTDIGTAFPTTGPCASSACAIHNAMFYLPGNAAYVGPYVDLSMGDGTGGGVGVETGGGMLGALRYGNRAGVEIGAAMSGNPGKGTTPTISRSTFTGCDASAKNSPCFDIGNTFAASHSATWSSNVFTITGGLSAGGRPFVPGMALSCSGCNSGLVALSISLPPTQSTVAGAGQVGQTFTVTASGAIGGSGSGTLTGGCSGASGTGSNCIDFDFVINTTGTYNTPAALNTCGVNNLQGTNLNNPAQGTFFFPNGTCVPTGVGALVRGFRIGSQQIMDTFFAPSANGLGSSYDFGADPGQFSTNTNIQGVIVQNESFACNLVAATIVQCVKGPQYTNGLFSGIGVWSPGQTFAAYADNFNSFSFMTGMVGYPGGQPFPSTPGSGYSPAANYTTGGVCPLSPTSGATVQAPAMGFTVSSGGTIINAYPTQIGAGIYGSSLQPAECSFPLSFNLTATISGFSSTTGLANLIIPTSTVIGSVSAPSSGVATLTVTNTPTVPLAVGQLVYAGPISIQLVITALGTGTGGAGTYTVSDANSGAITCPATGTSLCINTTIINGTVVHGENLSWTGGTGNSATVVSGPLNGLGGTYIISCPASCSAAAGTTITSGPTAGSGGSITTPPQGWGIGFSTPDGIGSFQTYDADSNLVGDQLEDNSGVSGNPLAGRFNTPAGSLESTGLPVRPFGMRRGILVNGLAGGSAPTAAPILCLLGMPSLCPGGLN
jgi:hypothetical protein